MSDLDVGMFILQCLHSYVPASDGRNLKRQPQEILPFLSDAFVGCGSLLILSINDVFPAQVNGFSQICNSSP